MGEHLDKELIVICYEYYTGWYRQIKYEYKNKDIVDMNLTEDISRFIYKPTRVEFKSDYRTWKSTLTFSFKIQNERPDVIGLDGFALITKFARKFIIVHVTDYIKDGYDFHIKKNGKVVMCDDRDDRDKWFETLVMLSIKALCRRGHYLPDNLLKTIHFLS